MPKNKTFIEKKEAITRQWYEYNAEGQVLGRLATEVAQKLICSTKGHILRIMTMAIM